MPVEVLEAIRWSRLTALKKQDGGVREIVVGDILRRRGENHGQANGHRG